MRNKRGKEETNKPTLIALGSDDLTLDQSETSIQILLEPNIQVTFFFYKIMTLIKQYLLFRIKNHKYFWENEWKGDKPTKIRPKYNRI